MNFKKTFIAAALAASFAAPAAFAYELPERPTAPTSEAWTPTAPIYQAPALLDYTRAEPTVLGEPTYPIHPTKDYPEVAPPTAPIYFSSTGLQNGMSPYFVAASKNDAEAAIGAYYSTLPLFAESDYYTDNQLLKVDYASSFSTYQPNFLVNTMRSDFVVYEATGNRVISTDVVEQIAAVLRGETITIDGRELNSVLVSFDGSPVLYTPEGAFGVMSGEPAYLAQTQQDALAQIESYLAAVNAGTYVPDTPMDWQIGNAVNVAHPNYTTYESYVQQFVPQMTAYRDAYNAWLAGVDAFINDYAAYSASVADYQAWQSENAPAIAANTAALAEAAEAYDAALTQYQLDFNAVAADQIDAMPLNRSMGGGYAPGVDAAAFGPAAIAAGEAATALGADAFAYGNSSTAVGDSAVAAGANGTALGANSISVGDDATAVGSGSVAVGAGSFAAGSSAYAEGENTVAIGTGSVAVNGNAIAMGSNALAIGGVAIGDGAISETDISVAIGRGARAVSSVAVGTGSQALGLNTTAVGDFAVAAGDLSVAVGANATAVGENSVALGAGTVATRDDSVSVGGRVITDVAEGTAPTDAVNVQQLEERLNAAIAAVPVFDGAALEQRVDDLSSRVDHVESKIKQVEKTASAGVAIAMAMSQPVALTADKPSALTAGIGHFNGQTAVGVAMTAAVRANVVTSFGAGFSNGGKAALRAGVSFSF